MLTLGCPHKVVIFDDEYKIVVSDILSCARQKFYLSSSETNDIFVFGSGSVPDSLALVQILQYF